MKRVSKLSLLLMVLAMIAVYIPSTYASEEECPVVTDPMTITEEPCLPEEEPPTDPCIASVECEPPTDPCFGTRDCEPPTDPCGISYECDPCDYSYECNPCDIVGMIDCPVEGPVVVTVTQPVTETTTQEGVSFNDSDLGVSLYVGQDESGAPVLEVYETQNQTTTGNFSLTVSQTELADAIAGLDGANMLLKSAGHVKIYVLTTGEIAIFVGPDSEGKVHVKVFDGIPWSKVYGFTIDPA